MSRVLQSEENENARSRQTELEELLQEKMGKYVMLLSKHNNYDFLFFSVQVTKQQEAIEKVKEEIENARSRQTELEELLRAEKCKCVMLLLKHNNYNLLAFSDQVAKQVENIEKMKKESENAKSKQTELEELLQAERGTQLLHSWMSRCCSQIILCLVSFNREPSGKSV